MPNPTQAPMAFRNGVTAANRVWLAPMTNKASHDDGHLSDDELHFLTTRAAGGFGVIESCATHIALDGQGWSGELGIFADRLIKDWQRLADGIHQHGALLFPQIFHGGKRALRGTGRPIPWSCIAYTDAEAPVRAGTIDDIQRVIQQFADAAERAQAAGTDGVELHGAHGYILSQFLNPANDRTDGWGGSLRDRARLVREVLRAIRARVRDTFVVGVRLSPEGRSDEGSVDLSELVQVAQWLCEDGADFINLSLPNATLHSQHHPGVRATRVLRDALPADVPIQVAGQIWTQQDAIDVLEHGADAVVLGRSAICNPAWPHRVGRDGNEPKRPPITSEELAERGVGSVFTNYLKRWPDFVSDG